MYRVYNGRGRSRATICPLRGSCGGGAPPHVPAYWIKVSANQDGSFTVTNARNGFSKTYPAKN